MPVVKTITIDKLNIDVEFVVGKNAKDNFENIDEASGHHIWFHTKGYSSSHIIARLEYDFKKKDLRYIVKQGAILCKHHSKMASEKNVEIIYTRVEHVVKTDIPGSVIVSHEKTITI